MWGDWAFEGQMAPTSTGFYISVFCQEARFNRAAILYKEQLSPNIPIYIRRCIIQIPIERACIQAIIPIAS